MASSDQARSRSKKRTKKAEQPVAPGDMLEYRMSVPVPLGHDTPWVTFGVLSEVRNNETAKKAVRRVSEFVEDVINDKVEALLGEDDE